MPTPKRGDVWIVDFGRVEDAMPSELAKPRPAVVVSDDRTNEARDGVVMVVPATTSDLSFETDVVVEASRGGLDRRSRFRCEQVRAITTDRIDFDRGRVGELDVEVLEAIDEQLRVITERDG